MFRHSSIIGLVVFLYACSIPSLESTSPVIEPLPFEPREEVESAISEFDLDRAERLLNRWPEPREAVWFHLQGRLATLQNEYEEAVAYQRQAISLQPQEANYHDYYAGAIATLMRESGFVRRLFLSDDLHEALEAAVRLEPNEPEYLFNLVQYHVIAPWPFGRDSMIESLAARLAEIDRHWMYAVNGLLASKEGEVDAAIRDYRRAWSGGHGVHQIFRPIIYNAFSEQKWETVYTVIDEQLSLDPDDQFALLWRGRAAIRSNEQLARGRNALARLSEMEHLDPRVSNRKQIALYLGRLHLLCGDRQRAIDVWREAIAQHGPDERLTEALSTVEE